MTDLIKEFEGLVLHPYFCPAEKLTFGHGHVIRAGDVICGVPASEIFRYAQSMNMSIKRELRNKTLASHFDFDMQEAETVAYGLYINDTSFARKAVRSLVKVDLNANQKEALISFIFNVGEVGFKASTLLRRLNEGDYKRASEEFKRWNKMTVGGKKVVSKGLTNRREAEARLFNKPIKLVT